MSPDGPHPDAGPAAGPVACFARLVAAFEAGDYRAATGYRHELRRRWQYEVRTPPTWRRKTATPPAGG